MNKCMFLGRLTKDPEMREYTAKVDGKKVKKDMAFFGLAVQRNKDESDFFNIKCFGRLAELAEDHLSKGKQILLSAHAVSGSYETDSGDKRYFTDFVADEIFFTGKKDDDEAPRKKKKSRDEDEDEAPKKKKKSKDEEEDGEEDD